jgi:uncharacterized membrane protein YbhN (UPF0104 family)
MEYSKTFTERALTRVKEPSVTSAVTSKTAHKNEIISLAAPIQLPAANPWQQIARRPMPEHPSRSTVATVFLISGVCLLLIGLALYFSGKSHGDDTLGDVVDNVFQTIAGQICMIIGGVFTIVGGIMKLTEPERRRY